MRNDSDGSWNALLVVSLVATFISLGYIAYLRSQPPSIAESRMHSQAVELRRSLRQLAAKADASSSEVARYTWSTSPENLGSTVLDRVSTRADQSSVQLAGFRTEQTTAVGHLLETPFMVTVEGPYANVSNFLKSFESADSKLTVNLLQITESDQGADRVTATLGLVGFLPYSRSMAQEAGISTRQMDAQGVK